MIILKIVRTELRNLFYSPVPWFLAIVFLIMCAYYYLVPLYETAYGVDWLLRHGGLQNVMSDDAPTSLSSVLFFGGDGIIAHVNSNLYLFIPLLTMGIISREYNSGTIKLLYSSPIKLRQILIGKYLAVMTFIMVLIAILGFFMVLGAFQIRNVDYGLFLSALLGLTLLAGAYAAIGLFMSSLTNYQIVSGLATFTVLFVLGRIGGLWQKYDFVRDLTWFLSLDGRVEQMLAGLIVTRDVIYFIVVIILFLSFTLFKLKGERESKPWTVKAGRYVGTITVALLVGYVTSLPRLVGYLDATDRNVNTIAPATQQIIKKMGNDPLEITIYGDLWGYNLGYALPEIRNAYLYRFWDKYIRFKPDIKFKYVYYYDNDDIYPNFPKKTDKQITGILAKRLSLDSNMFIPPAEIRKQIDPYAEDLNVFMTARYKGDTVNLRTYGNPNDPWPNEQEIASKFKRLIERKWPKVYFLTGHLERSITKTGEREFSLSTTTKSFRGSLVNAAFDVDTLSLEKQDIPPGATALILADPKTELGIATRKKLERYIAGGGNLLVLGEPGKEAVLNPVLRNLDVQQMKGQLVMTSFNETPDKVKMYPLKSYLEIKQLDEIDKQALLALGDQVPQTQDGGGDPSIAALSYKEKSKFNIKPLMRTFPDEPEALPATYPPDATAAQRETLKPVRRQTWLKMGRLVTDSVPPVFRPQDGDIRDSSFVTAVSLTRKLNNREQRAAVFGDADFMSNHGGAGNDIYNWFDYGEHPVLIPRPHYRDGNLIVSAPTVKKLIISCLWVMPSLMLLAGTILLIRRRRK